MLTKKEQSETTALFLRLSIPFKCQQHCITMTNSFFYIFTPISLTAQRNGGKTVKETPATPTRSLPRATPPYRRWSKLSTERMVIPILNRRRSGRQRIFIRHLLPDLFFENARLRTLIIKQSRRVFAGIVLFIRFLLRFRVLRPGLLRR